MIQDAARLQPCERSDPPAWMVSVLVCVQRGSGQA